MTTKILKIAFFFNLLFTGCASQVKISMISGIYEGDHLLLHKQIVLKPDSTYLYIIEGDMYVNPIKQEGFWDFKNGKVRLNSKHNVKAIQESKIDSLQGRNLSFYLYNANGEPVYDFSGVTLVDGDLHPIQKLKGNLYVVDLQETPRGILVRNTNNLYKDFSLNLSSINTNIFRVYLFSKDELSKSKWKFKYYQGKLYQRGLEFRKKQE